MTGATLTLYTAGRDVQTAYAALVEKELPFTVSDGDPPRSPTGKPVILAHGELLLTDTMVITEYLAESFPFPKHPRLFPGDYRERAQARELMMFLRANPGPAELFALAELVVPEDRPTLFPAWCIADADLCLALQRAGELSPKLAGYVGANGQRPSLRGPWTPGP
jgi:hypothetical protein